MGDANTRPEDVDRAAQAVRISLEQLIDHAGARGRPGRVPHTAAAPAAAETFDVCKTNVFPAREPALRATPEAFALAPEVLAPTPVPGAPRPVADPNSPAPASPP